MLLHSTLLTMSLLAAPAPDPVAVSIERAHAELWKRFVYTDRAILYDYAALDGSVSVPTPEELAAAKPNALGWWCPIENGAFFTGLYLEALCNRWQARRDQATAAEARRAASGLMLLSEVGSVPGFIARGVSTDGRSHPIIGSDDQTYPWFYGLWCYLRSGIPGEAERRQIAARMAEVASALEGYRWRMPCDHPGDLKAYGFRGNWSGADHTAVPRLLFVLRAVYDVTGDSRWLELYRAKLQEKPGRSPQTRLEICAEGYPYEAPGQPMKHRFWYTASSQAGLHALAQMEEDATIRARFQEGLRRTAERSLPHVAAFARYDNNTPLVFDENWRRLEPLWKPQANVNEAVAVAMVQVKEWGRISPKRNHEDLLMKEPLFAAWAVVHSGDPEIIRRGRDTIRAALAHYDWARLHTSAFFMAECVYYEGARYGL